MARSEVPLEPNWERASVGQLARLLGVATTKLFAFIRAGELRAVDFASPGKSRRRLLILRADYDAFERSRAVRVSTPERREHAQAGPVPTSFV